jgi:hypothetical protein
MAREAALFLYPIFLLRWRGDLDMDTFTMNPNRN